jgi:hypothetical protein
LISTFFLTVVIAAGAVREAPMFLIVPLAMAGFGYFFMKKLVWDLVDEVYDGGEYLLVRNRGDEERVPLINVMNINVMFSNPPRITLRLVNAGKFGR